MITDIRLVFTPAGIHSYNYPRFLVSQNTLANYITQENANKTLLRAKNQKTNKSTVKFRKYGKIDIYLK